jgi:hypothetical protein
MSGHIDASNDVQGEGSLDYLESLQSDASLLCCCSSDTGCARTIQKKDNPNHYQGHKKMTTPPTHQTATSQKKN